METTGVYGRMLMMLDRWILYSILAVAFFLALSPTAATVALGAGSLSWAIKLIVTRGKVYRRTPFDRVILCFVFFSAVSVFVSPDPGFSFYNYYNLMGRYLLIYYLVTQNISTMRQVKLLVGVMAAAAMIVVSYGFYQSVHGIDITDMRWVDGDQFPELKTRVFSTMQNPNILAGYLIVMMSMAFGLICTLRSPRKRGLLILFFAAMGVCLTMTYSRGALLSLMMVITAYAAFKDRRLLAGLAALVFVVGLVDTSLAERVLSSFDASDTSSNMRLALWESTLAMIIEHPLFGIGWGAYWMVYPQYDFFIQNDSVRIVHAHNMYLNFAAEIGLAGFFSFMACLLGHLQLALTSTHLRQSAFLNGLTLGSGIAIICIAINGITDYVLFNIELSMLYWLVCALIVLICRRKLD